MLFLKTEKHIENLQRETICYNPTLQSCLTQNAISFSNAKPQIVCFYKMLEGLRKFVAFFNA